MHTCSKMICLVEPFIHPILGLKLSHLEVKKMSIHTGKEWFKHSLDITSLIELDFEDMFG